MNHSTAVSKYSTIAMEQTTVLILLFYNLLDYCLPLKTEPKTKAPTLSDPDSTGWRTRWDLCNFSGKLEQYFLPFYCFRSFLLFVQRAKSEMYVSMFVFYS